MTSDNEFMPDFTYKMGEQYTMDMPVGLPVLNPHFIKNKLSIKAFDRNIYRESLQTNITKILLHKTT